MINLEGFEFQGKSVSRIEKSKEVISEPNRKDNIASSKESDLSNARAASPEKLYPGDRIEVVEPLALEGLSTNGKWQKFDFPDAAFMVCLYNSKIREGAVTLYPWQIEDLQKISTSPASGKHPFKYCLVTCNGSGKDAFIIASIVVYFMLCKIRYRWVITSSSGVQLTSQTETYISNLCRAVNEYHNSEIFKIRQRFITCRVTGSEARLFATDEEGKAEGYHPMDPDSEMGIIVNEAKSVTPQIHQALKRCTGFTHWLEISSPGQPTGDLYEAFTKWPNTRHVDYTMCPHAALGEMQEDIDKYGAYDAYVNSKWRGLFTWESKDSAIPQELIDRLLKESFEVTLPSKLKVKRYGIDLAAGGDENAVYEIDGTKALDKLFFRERDTEVTADRIDAWLKSKQVPKDYPHIYADDGGVGKSIIDKLVRKGWSICRVLNQHAATNKVRFGNKGAENWFRAKRIFEEKCFDPKTLDEVTIKQLVSRQNKPPTSGGRIFLESKKEAKAHGRPSPDRADALILALTGLSVEDYLKDEKKVVDAKPKVILSSQQDVEEYYENQVTFKGSSDRWSPKPVLKKCYNSLKRVMNN